MKIILAPDSFKGSLSALEACAAMKRGVLKVFPNAEIVEIPLADGGEGTLTALTSATQCIEKTTQVRGPLDEEIEAKWVILPDGSAVIELAQAAGLTLTPLEKRDALRASTWGVGQMVRAARDAGCRRFLIGLGGSATTDGGTGLLSALGARFFDKNDVVLPNGGGYLGDLSRIEMKFFAPRFENCEFVVLCDVDNSLCGERGAAHIFGPQKSATPKQVELLDANLRHFASICSRDLGSDYQNEPGTGAAGGTAYGLKTFLGAQFRSGIEVVLETTDFGEHLKGATLVLTGEGSLDTQTLSGKTVAGVCQLAQEHNVPVVAFAGKVDLTEEQQSALGLKAAFSICDARQKLSYCLENAGRLLENAVEQFSRTW